MLKILYLLSLSYFIIASETGCNPDYAFSFEAGGWLKLHLTPQTWEEALVRCFDEGSVLASPLNKGLANALRTQIEQSCVNGHIFLGTHDLHSKGDYVSIEGVPLCDLEIELSVHCNRVKTSDCLSMTADGSSYYSSCEDPLPFICYRKHNNETMNECGTFDNEYRLNNQTGSCYKVHYDKQSWPRAYRICASEGGHLVILNDAAEASYVTGMFPPRTEKSDPWERFHVGLRCWGKERVWTTIHGDRIENVFNKWNPGQPDDFQGVQNRGALLWTGDFDDVDLEIPLKFVCEKSPHLKRFQEKTVMWKQNNIKSSK